MKNLTLSQIGRQHEDVACFLSLYCDDCRLTHMDFIGFEENLPKSFRDTDQNMGLLQISAQKYGFVWK